MARSNPRLTAASRRRPCADFAAGGGAEAEPRGGGRREKQRGARRGEEKIFRDAGGGGGAAALFHRSGTSGGPRGAPVSLTCGRRVPRDPPVGGSFSSGCTRVLGGRYLFGNAGAARAGAGDRLLALLTWP